MPAGSAQHEHESRQHYWQARLGREYANLRVAVEYCLSEPGEAEAPKSEPVEVAPEQPAARAPEPPAPPKPIL